MPPKKIHFHPYHPGQKRGRRRPLPGEGQTHINLMDVPPPEVIEISDDDESTSGEAFVADPYSPPQQFNVHYAPLATEQFAVLPPSPPRSPEEESEEEEDQEDEPDYSVPRPFIWDDVELAWFRHLREDLMRAPALNFAAAFDSRIWQGWEPQPLIVTVLRDDENDAAEDIQGIRLHLKPLTTSSTQLFYISSHFLLEQVDIIWSSYGMPIHFDENRFPLTEDSVPAPNHIWWPMHANDSATMKRVEAIAREIEADAKEEVITLHDLTPAAREALKWLERMEVYHNHPAYGRLPKGRRAQTFILAVISYLWRRSFTQNPSPNNLLSVGVELDAFHRKGFMHYELFNEELRRRQRYSVNPWYDSEWRPRMDYEIKALTSVVAPDKPELLMALESSAAWRHNTMASLMWADRNSVTFTSPDPTELWQHDIKTVPGFKESAEAANIQYGPISIEREYITYGIDLADQWYDDESEEEEEEHPDLPGYPRLEIDEDDEPA